MQSFVLDRHTDPNNPALKVSQNDKIPVYASVDDAEADLTNLETGQILGISDDREIINAGSARPLVLTQSSSINTIQFDTRFVIDTASAITVTLSGALYAGCTVTIINATAIRHMLAGTFLNNRIPPLMANCIVTLVWNGTAWQMLSYQDNGDSTDETFTGRFWSDNKPIYAQNINDLSVTLQAGSWQNIISAPNNIDKICFVNILGLDASGNYAQFPISIGCNQNKTYIQYFNVTNVNYGGTINEIYLEYTKTTD